MTLVILDLETAGPELHHPVIQWAAVAVDENFREIDTCEEKLQFSIADADPKALEMNCYSADAWQFAEKPDDGWYMLSAFLKKHATVEKISQRTGKAYKVAKICGHNLAGFDFPRIEAAFKSFGMFIPVDYNVLDTLHLWRWLNQLGVGPATGRLTEIANYYGLSVIGAHDALADCRLVAAVLPRLLKDLKAS